MPHSRRSKYYIGLDGGQSETFAAICGSDGMLLGTGRSGRCVLGAALCGENIAAAVRGALLDAGLMPGTEFVGAVFGLSGGFDVIEVSDYVRAHRAQAVWDAHIALAGAAGRTPPADSVLVIAGTGAVAVGKRADGVFTRCGGWGYVLGDPGSGCEVGRQVFEAAARDTDGRGPHTALTELLMSFFQTQDLLGLKKMIFEGNPLVLFPPLAGLCDIACAAGDGEALKIGREAGRELAALATGLTAKGGIAKNCRIWRAGGMFNSTVIAASFERFVKLALPEAALCESLLPPCLGAVLMAAGDDPEDMPAFIGNLQSSAENRNLKGSKQTDQ